MHNLAFKTSAPSTEDHLSMRDFERISQFVNEQVGIKLPPAKRMMIEGRLRKRMRAVGAASFQDYCDWLFNRGGMEDEACLLINTMTTNKTDFFREEEHYELLERVIIPELLARREANPLLKIWSAASSNGAEAYSTAMLLEDMVSDGSRFRYAILGTDVSTDMLAHGRRAVYSADWMEPVSARMQMRYVMQARRKTAPPEVRIVPELRRHVRFSYLNLMNEDYGVDTDIDVVFLRNVLIYFEKPVQEAVIRNVVGHLRPGGYLLLGHSESMISSSIPITQIASATFRKNP